MNKAFEKIIEKLEEAKSNVPVNRLLDDIIKDKPKELGQLMAYNKAIEIVKQEAEQYNNAIIDGKYFFKLVLVQKNAISAVDFAMDVLIGTKILIIGYISRRDK